MAADTGINFPGEKPDSPPTDESPDPRRWLALIVLLVALFMDLLDVTIVNVALPSIQSDLGGGYSAIQWVTAGYALAFALLLITGGRLGDIFGRKRVFMLGVAGFTLASLFCGIAQEPWQLSVARVLQGAFAAIMVPQVLAIIHVVFPAEERGKAFGLAGAIGGLAAIMGMVLGGVLTSWDLFGLGWRTIFLINIPVGIGALLVGAQALRESKDSRGLRLDLTGVALASVALLLLFFPLLQGREHGWPAWGFVSMILAVPVFALFIVHQRRMTRTGGFPLVPMTLFGQRGFSSGVSVHLLFNIGMGIFFLSWTLYMQIGLGWSPLRAGLSAAPFCIGAAPGAAVSVAVLMPKFGRKVIQIGVLLMVLGLGSYAWSVVHLGSDMGFVHQLLPLLVFGVGFGFVAAPLPEIALSEVPRQDAGSASGVFNANQQLGAALGVALTSIVFFGLLGGHASDSARDATPELKRDLVATGMSTERADAAVASFAACAKQSAESSGEGQGPAACGLDPALQSQPAVAEALADAGKETTANTFADTFRVALLSIIGILVLAFAVIPLLPQRRVAAPEQGDDTPDTVDEAAMEH
ncbi:MFS transporter [Streptomyces sp. E11-3]|uniref:MFS transporter n=1 Tax=Streptomyces sp. E11-3 TaxID=3110112 RepID=UPI00397FCA40